MAGRRQRQLRAGVAADRADRKWKSILGRHSKLRRTARRGLSGRDPDNIRYNTALRVLQGDNPAFHMQDHPGLKGAQKCMKRAMMKGASMRDAYTGCGLQDIGSGWASSFVSERTTKEQRDALKYRKGNYSFKGVQGLDQFTRPQRRRRR